MPRPKSLPGLPKDYTTKFFTGDGVARQGNPAFRGKVLRCWADEDGAPPPSNPWEEPHPLDRPLLRGEVGITDLDTGVLDIVPESSLQLLTREFLKGDVVKRSLTEVESATIIDVRSEVLLEHAMTGEKGDGQWVAWEDLGNSMDIEARDRVVYDEWVGTVEEVFEEGTVEGSTGAFYRLAEMGGILEPGRTVSDLSPKDSRDYDLRAHLPPGANPDRDRLIDVRPVIVLVTWHALNQMLPVSEHEKHPEPKRLWMGSELKDLTHFDEAQNLPPQVGATVKFRSLDEERRHGFKPSYHLGGMKEIRTLKVSDTRISVKLRWQDGSETEESALSLVPYRDVDDYEAWPGEHIIWRGDNGERRPAVIQKVNARQRVADLLFTDTRDLGTVSVLEIDVGTTGRTHYGVGVGQTVLLCENHHSPIPEVPALGRFETQMDQMVWREDMAKKAEEYAASMTPAEVVLPQGDRSKVDWYGEVVKLSLDGTVDVRLANGEKRTVTISQLQILGDASFMEEMMGGPMGAEDLWGEPMELDEEAMSQASWETMSDDQGEFGVDEVDDDDEMDGDEAGGVMVEMDEDEQERRDVEEVDPMVAPSSPVNGAISMPGAYHAAEAGPSTATPVPATNGSKRKANGNGNGNATIPKQSLDTEDEHWQRFEMLEEAPADHHYIGESSNQTGAKTYHSRLAKEHRALASSLPENILVRTYENRTDLMRVLIMGPEGTPYADAPFVFDVYLNPTKFPHEPPVVHFHSHTFGKGRCNPNLYEEGKVCLSVLGTWSGDKSESWNPAKSSLLQVFVSISGLVLVRSPYHCEPAFAKLEGTKEGKVNSRLYSEKAYVLSRSFVRTALERPPTGLEEELKHFYLTKGRLAAVIEHAKRLIQAGEEEAEGGVDALEENEEMWDGDAMGSLTMGAILSLKRTIVALEKLLAERDGES